ncbi:alanine--tRNA ligase [Candidatus Kaiserbacteria bacterium]|nr:alanine--tRNA ligase [Candidatus Kaiserbacteria bacterium]
MFRVMTLNEVREKYLEFFEARGHTIVPSAPLVPQNDPTTLFTGSGMQPLLPYLLGKDHPGGVRLANSQKCFRAMDIEEVGDNRHTTFFEMLGNWSLGDYFKKEQLPWLFEFLTKEIDIPKERLWVTCFEGDEKYGIPRDTESAEIWKNLGISEDHIHFYGKKNWWSRAGEPENMPAGEPGGPDSEVFFEFTDVPHDFIYEATCHPNCDCGRFMEIGNSVFMQYVKKPDGTFGLLPKQNVDFGGGLERITAAAHDNPDVFEVAHKNVIKHLEAESGKKYEGNAKVPFRVVADHVKAAVFLIADDVKPSNVERGYVVRRLLRRAMRYSDMFGVESGLSAIADIVVSDYVGVYDLAAVADTIRDEIHLEEERFRKTLARGLKELEKGTDAFTLFTTYGFPIELTHEVAREKGITVNEEVFKREMEKHQELSRAGSEQKFKGGLADASEATTRLHTAHHLLLKALQIVLGPHVKQRGSNITAERLRIDFSHGEKMTSEQLSEVERIVNEKIKEDLPVVHTEMPKEEAEKLGAEHEFGAKYPDKVSIYSVGSLDNTFSIEFCGGPHVTHTGVLGTFKIQKEEASSAGIRRIKAALL